LVSSGTFSVERPVAGFHVINRHLHPLGDDGRDSAVGITENEQSIGLLRGDDSLGPHEDRPQHGSQRARVGLEEVVGATEAEILEEDLVQLVVVVLPGVHQDLIAVLVDQLGHRLLHLGGLLPAADPGGLRGQDVQA